MKLKIQLSTIQENREKKQLRFSAQFIYGDLSWLITGLRIKNNRLLFPTYLVGGQHKPLIFPSPKLLDIFAKMLQDELGYHYPDYLTRLDTEQCLAKQQDLTSLLGERTLTREFEVNHVE